MISENAWGLRPPLCTYKLNMVRITSWGWWDKWDDTTLQTQDSKFEHWRSEAEHATSRSQRIPTIFNARAGRARDLQLSKQAAYTTAPEPLIEWDVASVSGLFYSHAIGLLIHTTQTGSPHALLSALPPPPPWVSPLCTLWWYPWCKGRPRAAI